MLEGTAITAAIGTLRAYIWTIAALAVNYSNPYILHAANATYQRSVMHFIDMHIGSGKTFTMGTAAGVKEVGTKGGSAAVIPQACRQVLQYMREAADTYDMQLKVREHLLLALTLVLKATSGHSPPPAAVLVARLAWIHILFLVKKPALFI